MSTTMLENKLKLECDKILCLSKKNAYLTKKDCKRIMRNFIDLLMYHEIFISSLANLNATHVQLIVSIWLSQDISDKSIMNKLAAIRYFYRLAPFSVEIPSNVQLGIRLTEQIKKPRKVIDIKQLMDSINHDVTENILEFQLYFGLTKSESLRLTCSHLLDQRILFLTKSITHNNKDRAIPIVSKKQRLIIEKRKELLKNNRSFLDVVSYQKLSWCYDAALVFADQDPKYPYHYLYIDHRLKTLNEKESNKHSPKALAELFCLELGMSSIYRMRHIINGY